MGTLIAVPLIDRWDRRATRLAILLNREHNWTMPASHNVIASYRQWLNALFRLISDRLPHHLAAR
ncbi:hypothetical protein [Microtetraspora malaysiensis]|uniref:hypothetical protein n=1 Tax=Microtetraspora malaysiensis TaxID=161358 RepID=UPI000A769EAD|nr:hypothetical protein [Microtetraspora malaysiensis]